MICIEGTLKKDQKYFLKDEKLCFCPSVFNTDDSMQVLQVDLAQLMNIKVLVEHEPAQTDQKGRELGATLGGMFGLIIAYLTDCSILGYSFMVLLSTSLGISLLEKSKKEKDAFLKLDFKDNSTITITVNREERAQLISLLDKYKDAPRASETKAIYFSSLTNTQKSIARDRYWQIPCLFWFMSIPIFSFLRWFGMGSKRMNEAQGIIIPKALENLATSIENLLAYQPLIAIIIIFALYITGTRRDEKLSRQDQIIET